MRGQRRIFSVATTIACLALASPAFAQTYIGGSNAPSVEVDLGALNALPGPAIGKRSTAPHHRTKTNVSTTVDDPDISGFQTTIIGGGSDAIAPITVLHKGKHSKTALPPQKPMLTTNELNATQLSSQKATLPNIPAPATNDTASVSPQDAQGGNMPLDKIPTPAPLPGSDTAPAILPNRGHGSDGKRVLPVTTPQTPLPPARDDYDRQRTPKSDYAGEPPLPPAGPAPTPITLPTLPANTPVTADTLNHAELTRILAEKGETLAPLPEPEKPVVAARKKRKRTAGKPNHSIARSTVHHQHRQHAPAHMPQITASAPSASQPEPKSALTADDLNREELAKVSGAAQQPVVQKTESAAVSVPVAPPAVVSQPIAPPLLQPAAPVKAAHIAPPPALPTAPAAPAQKPEPKSSVTAADLNRSELAKTPAVAPQPVMGKNEPALVPDSTLVPPASPAVTAPEISAQPSPPALPSKVAHVTPPAPPPVSPSAPLRQATPPSVVSAPVTRVTNNEIDEINPPPTPVPVGPRIITDPNQPRIIPPQHFTSVGTYDIPSVVPLTDITPVPVPPAATQQAYAPKVLRIAPPVVKAPVVETAPAVVSPPPLPAPAPVISPAQVMQLDQALDVAPPAPPAPRMAPPVVKPAVVETAPPVMSPPPAPKPVIPTVESMPLDQTIAIPSPVPIAPTPPPAKQLDRKPAPAPLPPAPLTPPSSEAMPLDQAPLPVIEKQASLLPPPPPLIPAPQQTSYVPPPTQQSRNDLSASFSPGSSALSADTNERLAALALRLKQTPDLRIELRSLASTENGSTSKARRTSLTRALAIKSYLTGQGIAEDRIDVRALGAPPGQPASDRVDFFLMR